MVSTLIFKHLARCECFLRLHRYALHKVFFVRMQMWQTASATSASSLRAVAPAALREGVWNSCVLSRRSGRRGVREGVWHSYILSRRSGRRGVREGVCHSCILTGRCGVRDDVWHSYIFTGRCGVRDGVWNSGILKSIVCHSRRKSLCQAQGYCRQEEVWCLSRGGFLADAEMRRAKGRGRPKGPHPTSHPPPPLRETRFPGLFRKKLPVKEVWGPRGKHIQGVT
jgi:hypothetical protein